MSNNFPQDIVQGMVQLGENLFIKNIIDPSNGKVNGNAPSLDMLYNQIHLALSVTGAVPGNWSQLSPCVKVRFAYMQLETAAHSMKPTQGHGSQWKPINNHLLFMSNAATNTLALNKVKPKNPWTSAP
ncbi:hypothetical protein PCANC_14160 [Puccinia coronata f. sp. avenae]|uniref:Uncharacterized protein n=1 Tax=Puccinia coronata f. sp. avenae TaxID=200324 RepID=A0A2N5UK51_9BASI|nr:hypothetical protein PCANC_14160 [Puccinia coronata f. sp. avenae]